jgi:hypothetical protein
MPKIKIDFLQLLLTLKDFLRCLTKDGKILDVLWSDKLSWARPYINENRRGTKPKGFSDILSEGDIVWLKKRLYHKEYFTNADP